MFNFFALVNNVAANSKEGFILLLLRLELESVP